MPELSVKLEQQLSDLRSDQIAYRLVLENQSSNPMRLIAIEPSFPTGVKLLEITNSSLAEANARKTDLLTELNNLLQTYLATTSESFREQSIQKYKEGMRQIFSVTGIFKFYFDAMITRSSIVLKSVYDTYSFKMTGLEDANDAYQRWVEHLPDTDVTKSLFQAKVEQLKRVYDSMTEDERSALTTIEAGGVFTTTYVLRFKRKLFEPVKYHLAIDLTHSTSNPSSPVATSIGENIQISPYPWSLSVVTVLASLLGVLVRLSLAGTVDAGAKLMAMAKSLDLFVAPIVAYVFFNVYEYTSLGKGFVLPISWRSALLIGVICGIAQDRILAALRAFIGA